MRRNHDESQVNVGSRCARRGRRDGDQQRRGAGPKLLQAGKMLQGQVLQGPRLPADQLLCAGDELLHCSACVQRIELLRVDLLCAGLDLLRAGSDVLQFDVQWRHGHAAAGDGRAPSCTERLTPRCDVKRIVSS